MHHVEQEAWSTQFETAHGTKPIYSIHLESQKPWHDNISNVWIDARSYAGRHMTWGQTHRSIKENQSAAIRTGRMIITTRRIWIWRLSDRIMAAVCAEQDPLPAKAIRRNQAVRAAGKELRSSERRGRAYDRRKRSGGRTPGSAQRPADLAIGSGSHTHTCAVCGSWSDERRRDRDLVGGAIAATLSISFLIIKGTFF